MSRLRNKRKRAPHQTSIVPLPKATSAATIPKTPDIESVASAEMVLYRHHSGPLPSPEQLAKYDHVVPGLAERIVRRDELVMELAQKQAEHRQRLEALVVRTNSRRASFGQILAFIITIAFGVLAYKLIMGGHEVAGSVFGTGTLGSIVAVFVTGRTKQSRELEGKRQEQNRAIEKRSAT